MSQRERELLIEALDLMAESYRTQAHVIATSPLDELRSRHHVEMERLQRKAAEARELADELRSS